MTPTLERQRLGQTLIDMGLLREEQLERALQRQRDGGSRKLLGEILMEMRLCSEAQVVQALARAFQLPFARLNPRLADPAILHLLPAPFMRQRLVLPLFLVQEVLTVAVCEPADLFLFEEIERLGGRTVQIVLAASEDIRAVLEVFLAEPNLHPINDGTVPAAEPDAPAESPAMGPAARLLNQAILQAVAEQADLVHVEPLETTGRIRFRIDGRLVERFRPSPAVQTALTDRLMRMAGLDPADTRPAQRGDAQLLLETGPVAMNVHAVRARHGHKLILRLRTPGGSGDRPALEIDELGLGYDMLKQWRSLLQRPGGVLVVSGPGQSGISTTLAASLRWLGCDDQNLCAVAGGESAVLGAGVSHFTCDSHDGLAPTVQAVLEQEPDVLMIDHPPDQRALTLAAQAALEGRRILLTLPAPDAVTALGLLARMPLEPYLLAAAFPAILSQRLLRRLCPHCRQPHPPTPAQRRQFELLAPAPQVLYQPKGCPECHQGYRGRIGIFELLTMNDELADALCRQLPLPDLHPLTAGYTPLRADALEKVRAGITTLEELTRVIPP